MTPYISERKRWEIAWNTVKDEIVPAMIRDQKVRLDAWKRLEKLITLHPVKTLNELIGELRLDIHAVELIQREYPEADIKEEGDTETAEMPTQKP